MKRWTRYCLIAMAMLAAMGGGFATHLIAATPSTPASDRLNLFLNTAVPDLNGKPRTLNEWKGKIRIINFWATWCPPCLHEIPYLVDAQKKWGDKNVQIIGVAVDNAVSVKPFASRLKMNYPLLIAEEQGQSLMANQGNDMGALPFTIVIDAQGRVTQRFAGAINPVLLDNWIKQAATAK